MRVNAYVLAADPTWLEASLAGYYDHVDRIVVVYDRRGLGWSGRPIRVGECLDRLRQLDRDGKVSLVEGDWSSTQAKPMESDTLQRRAGLTAAAEDADWVLQIDTDEVLPRFEVLRGYMSRADELGCLGIEWPMRVLYRRLGKNDYLQVCCNRGLPYVEYPGPIAVKPHAELIEARRISGKRLRVVPESASSSLQLQRPPEAEEVRWTGLEIDDSILHNSWARPLGEIVRKVASWSHSDDFSRNRYLILKWLPSSVFWRGIRDFHPFAKGLWPELERITIPDLAGVAD